VPVAVEYRLERDATFLKVKTTVDNQASDHWLRANFPTEVETDISSADSHFDVVQRPIPLPDPTGWVEAPGGTHPLRTFVDLSDGKQGLAILTQGNFEYEVFEDQQRTLAITLFRALRVNFMKERVWEPGIECQGLQTFEYAILPHTGDWQTAGLLNRSADYAVPVRCALTGRGKGHLSHEASLFALKNPNLHVTCVKQAENGQGLIVRLFNPTETEQLVSLEFGMGVKGVQACRMDESLLQELQLQGCKLEFSLAKKKIGTYRVFL